MITPCLFVVLNIQVYFVLRKELLQADILELDTLFSLLSTLGTCEVKVLYIVHNVNPEYVVHVPNHP